MSKEDYFKYYIQGSDHYLLPKNIFDELFQEMLNWKEECKQQKEELITKNEMEKQILTNQLCVLATLGTLGVRKLHPTQHENIQKRIEETKKLRDKREV